MRMVATCCVLASLLLAAVVVQPALAQEPADRFTQAIEKDPTNPNAYITRGMALTNRGMYDEALADFNKAIELDPKNAMAYDSRGTAYAKSGDPAKAHHDFDKAIELDPELASAYRHRGDNLIEFAKTDEGNPLFDEAVNAYEKKWNRIATKNLRKTAWQPLNTTAGPVTRGAAANYIAKLDYDIAERLERDYRGRHGGHGGGGGGYGYGYGCGCGPGVAGPGMGGPGMADAPLAVYPAIVPQGEMITLVANPADLAKGMPAKATPSQGGAYAPRPKRGEKEKIQSVDFYRDVNGNGKLDEGMDLHLASDSDGSDGYSVQVPTAKFPPGKQTFFAAPAGEPCPCEEASAENLAELMKLLKGAAEAERMIADKAEKASAGQGLSEEQAKKLQEEQEFVADKAKEVAEGLKQAAPQIAAGVGEAGKPIKAVTNRLKAAERTPGEKSKDTAGLAAEKAEEAAEALDALAKQIEKAAKEAPENPTTTPKGQPLAGGGMVTPPKPGAAPGPGSGPGKGPGPGSDGGGDVHNHFAADDDEECIECDEEAEEAIDRALGFIEDDDDYDDALVEWDRLVEYDPDDLYYRRQRAGAYLRTGGYDYAVRDYDRLLTLHPRNADLYYNRGCAYRAAGQLDKALLDFTKSIELNETGLAFNNRGATYAMQGQYQLAIADFDRAIAINGDDPLAYRNRALAYKKLGEIEKAQADFDTMQKLSQN